MTIPPPLRLRCEYLQDPIGIDIPKPRLSWVLRHFERGQKPSAYEIIVSSTARGAGDCWDSGRINTDRHFHIEYGGKKLESRRRYYWRVRWWDKNGRPSAYSKTAFFEMGLLDTNRAVGCLTVLQHKKITQKRLRALKICLFAEGRPKVKGTSHRLFCPVIEIVAKRGTNLRFGFENGDQRVVTDNQKVPFLSGAEETRQFDGLLAEDIRVGDSSVDD